ncbi:MAG: LysR family transcriptional regulator [Halopseudomonas sp.]
MPDSSEFDLNLLRVFDAIYRLGTITRAAKHLNVSQPAVSHALARLREIYSDPLFSRSPKGMQPSPVAAEIALNITEALQQTQISLAKAGCFDPLMSDRHFRFSMSGAYGLTLIPFLLKTLRKEAPNMTMEVLQYPRNGALDELVNGDSDFIIDHHLPEHPQMKKMMVAKEPYVCAVRHGHPLVKTGINLEQYLAGNHIHASSRRRGTNYIDLALQSMGKRRHISFQTQHYLETPYALNDTDMILTAPRSVAARHDCVILPLPFKLEPISIYLYWHLNRDADPASLWLRQHSKHFALQALAI